MPGLYSQCVANIRVVLCSTFLPDQVYVIPRPCNFTSGKHKFIYLFIHIFKVTDCKSIYSVACIRLDVLLNLHSSSKEFAQSAQHTIIQSANSIFDWVQYCTATSITSSVAFSKSIPPNAHISHPFSENSVRNICENEVQFTILTVQGP